jgi:hypothetical protein
MAPAANWYWKGRGFSAMLGDGGGWVDWGGRWERVGDELEIAQLEGRRVNITAWISPRSTKRYWEREMQQTSSFLHAQPLLRCARVREGLQKNNLEVGGRISSSGEPCG